MHFTLYLPCAGLYAFHCLLFNCFFPVHASMHFTLYLPYACLYAFHRLPSLRMHLRTSPCTCPIQSTMHFSVYFPCACIIVYLQILQAELQGRTSRTTFVLKSCGDVLRVLFFTQKLRLCSRSCGDVLRVLQRRFTRNHIAGTSSMFQRKNAVSRSSQIYRRLLERTLFRGRKRSP